MPKLVRLLITFIAFLTPIIFLGTYLTKNTAAANCGMGSTTAAVGDPVGISYSGVSGGLDIFMWDGGATRVSVGTTVATTPTNPVIFANVTIASVPNGSYGFFIDALAFGNISCGNVTVTGGGGAGGTIGKINPPASIPNPAADPNIFVGGIIQGLISFLLIAAFVIALIWTIFAGIRFITAGGDEKTVSSAWSQIYWGLIGMVVVLGSFAIIKLVETFFGVNIITNFRLPTI